MPFLASHQPMSTFLSIREIRVIRGLLVSFSYAWIDADKQGKVGRTKRSAAAAWSLLLSVKFV